jgi:hypothetical protein
MAPGGTAGSQDIQLLLLFFEVVRSNSSLLFIYQYPGPWGAPKLCLMAPNADYVDNSYVYLCTVILYKEDALS